MHLVLAGVGVGSAAAGSHPSSSDPASLGCTAPRCSVFVIFCVGTPPVFFLTCTSCHPSSSSFPRCSDAHMLQLALIVVHLVAVHLLRRPGQRIRTCPLSTPLYIQCTSTTHVHASPLSSLYISLYILCIRKSTCTIHFPLLFEMYNFFVCNQR